MKNTKSIVYLSIVIVLVCCLIITGCSKKSDNKDSAYKTNVDLNNDGICDVNCDLDNDLVADTYIDMNDDLLYDYDDIRLILKQEISHLEGKLTFSFYCPIGSSAKECKSEVNNSIITVISEVYNNPYNTVYQGISDAQANIDYENITAQSHKVEVTVESTYSLSKQKEINGTINSIIKDIITPDLQNDKEKIKAVHDYLITHTDLCHTDDGTLVNLYTTYYDYGYFNTCSYISIIFQTHMANDLGYSDLMSLFLTKMGYENVRIFGNSHVWNAVKINNVWYHIDILWDKPVIAGTLNETAFLHQYFMLTTEELNAKNDNGHTYDKNKYYMIK